MAAVRSRPLFCAQPRMDAAESQHALAGVPGMSGYQASEKFGLSSYSMFVMIFIFHYRNFPRFFCDRHAGGEGV
jgi:hypothetical protein